MKKSTAFVNQAADVMVNNIFRKEKILFQFFRKFIDKLKIETIRISLTSSWILI